MRPAWRRAAAAVLTAALAGVIGPGCPSRDLSVEVTTDGSNEVVLACESFRDACSPLTSCHHNRFLCDQITCTLREPCTVGDGSTTWDPTLPMAAQLVLLSAAEPPVVQATGSCEALDLRPCTLRVPLVSGGCADSDVDPSACIAATMGAAVAASLGQDLTFGGFTDPSSAILALAIYQVPGASMACDVAPSVGAGDCVAQNLVGAAGFAQPVGGSVYDITCASCQAGELESVGRDTGPCPALGAQCFADQVRQALSATE